MKGVQFDYGRYYLSPAGRVDTVLVVSGTCKQCGNDTGRNYPILEVNEYGILISIVCPECGNICNLYAGHGEKAKCEPESSPVNTSADF